MVSFTLHGNLTKDLEVKLDKNGKPYVRFTVASDDRPGKESETSFVDVAAFGEWVNDLTDLKKGSWIKASGRIVTGEYEGRKTYEFIAAKIERPVKQEVPA